MLDASDHAVPAAWQNFGCPEQLALSFRKRMGRFGDCEADASGRESGAGGSEKAIGDAKIGVVGRIPGEQVESGYGQARIGEHQAFRGEPEGIEVAARCGQGAAVGIHERDPRVRLVCGQQQTDQTAATPHVQHARAGFEITRRDFGKREASRVRAAVAKDPRQRVECVGGPTGKGGRERCGEVARVCERTTLARAETAERAVMEKDCGGGRTCV